MPVNRHRTATAATRRAWRDLRPGDIGWSDGAGGVGWVVRIGSASPYGHCFVVVETNYKGNPDMLLVDEAFPAFPPWRPGLRRQPRRMSTVAAVARVWRNETERKAILAESTKLVEARPPYAWSEIFVIFLAMFLPHRLIPTTDLSRAVICSNHVSQCIIAARPEDYARYFRYPPWQEWPGGVHYDLQAMLWEDNTMSMGDRISRKIKDQFTDAFRVATAAVAAVQEAKFTGVSPGNIKIPPLSEFSLRQPPRLGLPELDALFDNLNKRNQINPDPGPKFPKPESEKGK